jgi:uncharacterized membrane protein YjdF
MVWFPLSTPFQFVSKKTLPIPCRYLFTTLIYRKELIYFVFLILGGRYWLAITYDDLHVIGFVSNSSLEDVRVT